MKTQPLDAVGFLGIEQEKMVRSMLTKASDGELYEIEALIKWEFSKRSGKVKARKGRK